MRLPCRVVTSFAAALGAMSALASDFMPASLAFTHGDWELACDNTGTCRAAGYQPGDSEPAVSVLLTRRAGAGEPVAGRVMIGQYGDVPDLSDLPDTFPLTLTIDGKAAGTLQVERSALAADLSIRQTTALLSALRRSTHIEWRSGRHRWHLSDAGSTAVLLKMDEYQSRLDTPGALVRRGRRDESGVPAAAAVPRVTIVTPKPPNAEDAGLAANPPAELIDALRGTLAHEDDCPLLDDATQRRGMTTQRLSDQKLMLTAPCWMAAYNTGTGVWVINDRPPYHPVLVTPLASEIGQDGTIHASHKGRGLGDCWSLNTWAWNGEQFIETAASTTGMCRLLAPGGAWQLPTRVVEMVR